MLSNTEHKPTVYGKVFLSDKAHKVSLTVSWRENTTFVVTISHRDRKSMKQKKGKEVEMGSFRRCHGEFRLRGGMDQRSPFVCLFCSVSFYGKQPGSVHIDAQHIQSHHSSCVRSGAWVIKVKSGHECRSRYRPTFQDHHMPVIQSTNTAGEQ